MSPKPETFYAIRCDYPGCEVIYESGDDCTYWADAYYEQDSAEESGWLCTDDERDYCPDHVAETPCPEPAGCEWCDDEPGLHLVPRGDTIEERLEVVRRRVLARAEYRLDAAERQMRYSLGDTGPHARRVERALGTIYTNTVERWTSRHG